MKTETKNGTYILRTDLTGMGDNSWQVRIQINSNWSKNEHIVKIIKGIINPKCGSPHSCLRIYNSDNQLLQSFDYFTHPKEKINDILNFFDIARLNNYVNNIMKEVQS